MSPYYWSMLGLIFDIIGAFFISVEAITIDNLKKLRDRILLPAHKLTISPRIEWVDNPGKEKRVGTLFVIFYIGAHYVVGAVVLYLLDRMMERYGVSVSKSFLTWYLSQSLNIKILVSVLIFFLAIFILFSVGELVHIAINRLTKSSVIMVDFIDRKTPDGTIGIIGFLLLLTGFLLQIYGNYQLTK